MPVQNWSYYYKLFFGFSHIYVPGHSAQSVLGLIQHLRRRGSVSVIRLRWSTAAYCVSGEDQLRGWE